MKIVLLGPMAAGCREAIEARLRIPHRLSVIPDAGRAADHAAELAEADVIVGWPLTQEIAAGARNVKLVQVSGAGVDGLRLDLLPPAVRVANTYHHEVAIAEWILMAMLVLARRVLEHDSRLRSGHWHGSCIWGEPPVLAELLGQSVLLIGVGHIAGQVAVRARAFGMRLVGVSRTRKQAAGFDELVPWRSWEDHLPAADFVVPTCPLTPETTGLIGAAQLARMKPAACLINITRGKVVDEQALFEALRGRRIAGAAIDVWCQYPGHPDQACLPSRFPFHELDNVLISPHISGWTRRTISGRVEDIVENIHRLAAGRELINLVR